MNNTQRIAISAIVLSAGAFVKLAVDEGYTETAIIPTTGDRPTLGFGMTQRPDGTPVQMGDRTNPVQALQRSMVYLDNQDKQIKRCVTAPLHQIEYDTLADFGYQYGITALCKSSMVARANIGDYAGSCRAYLAYRYAANYDCSTLVNGQPNKRCWGVWARQQERFKKCMTAQ